MAVDNGGRPFRVHLTSVSGPGTAEVDVRDEEDDLYRYWRSFEYERAMIGKDPDEKNLKKAWWHGGNALLLRLRGPGEPVYVFVGWEIYAFSPPDEILQFVSRMGNSAVPYPVAVGRVNTYLMTENTYIPNKTMSGLASLGNPHVSDPYYDLYAIDLTTGLPCKSDRAQHKQTMLWRASHRLAGRKVLHKRLWG